MALVGIAKLVLQQFIHVNLFRLALPLLGSMALVRAVVFVLRQAFPKATWLTAWERIIATFIWGWLALYITDLAPHVIDRARGRRLPARRPAPQPVDGPPGHRHRLPDRRRRAMGLGVHRSAPDAHGRTSIPACASSACASPRRC
jgi:hypothetical protein